MSKSILEAKALQDEAAAYAWVEARIWPEGPVCPHCGGVDRISKMGGKSTRIGVYKCYQCRRQFSVKVKTVFEDSHVPMRLWLQAMYLLCSSKKGISSNKLHRILGLTLKTAWFMSHRIREVMRSLNLEPMGGAGMTVEIDETSQGFPEGFPKELKSQSGWQNRNVVFTLVERGGSVRSFHVEGTTIGQLIPIIRANISRETAIMTDSASWYKYMNRAVTFPAMTGSTTRAANTSGRVSGLCIRTRLRATTASSSAGCVEFTSIARRSVCTDTCRNLISGTATALPLALMTLPR